MKVSHTVLTLCCAAALAACGGQENAQNAPQGASSAAAAQSVPAGSVAVQTLRGEAVVPQNPERVAVYDLGAIDTLTKLGVKIGASVDSQGLAYLDAPLKDAVKAGTLFDPNYEALNAYKPQLVIIGGRMAKAHDELAKIAPTIEMTIDSNRKFSTNRPRPTRSKPKSTRPSRRPKPRPRARAAGWCCW